MFLKSYFILFCVCDFYVDESPFTLSFLIQSVSFKLDCLLYFLNSMLLIDII